MNSLELAFRVARLRFFERRVLINDIKKASESVALATTLLAVANMRVALVIGLSKLIHNAPFLS